VSAHARRPEGFGGGGERGNRENVGDGGGWERAIEAVEECKIFWIFICTLK
jgi:hypothetical protein